jgi:D-arabinose 5-phosphate isomerase GutQ
MAKNALAIVLSVSGETEEILRFASQFSLTTARCCRLPATSTPGTKLADLACSGVFRKRVYDTIQQRKFPSSIFWNRWGVNWRRN